MIMRGCSEMGGLFFNDLFSVFDFGHRVDDGGERCLSVFN